jgi:hypothetical protein
MGGSMTKIKFARAYATLAVLVMMLPAAALSADNAIRGKFVLDAIANCENPPVQNFPVHSEGTASLSTDRSARLDLVSNVSGAVQYNAKLGGKPTEAPEGSASLHVVGRHTLQAIRDYPNNIQVVNMTIIGHTCSLKIENRLKPGKRQYTFHTAIGLAYCSKPQVVKAECTVY